MRFNSRSKNTVFNYYSNRSCRGYIIFEEVQLSIELLAEGIDISPYLFKTEDGINVIVSGEGIGNRFAESVTVV